MTLRVIGGIGVWLAALSQVLAQDYVPFTDPGVVVTGIRATSNTSDDVVITASYTTGGITTAALYTGSLAAAPTAPSSSWVKFTPVLFDPVVGDPGSFSQQTVTSSTFYGPNTALFSPSLGAGNVNAVGSYKYSQSAEPSSDHGVLYQGSSTSATGTWTQLDATSLVGSDTLLNTLGHSTMGNYVVGNYDTDIATGIAFLYDIDTQTWANIQPNPTTPVSVTAYGIWQNSDTSYTITGGVHNATGGLDQGYLVNYNYNSSTSEWEYKDYKAFNYNNASISSVISHFDGIVATEDGFNLTGFYVGTAPGSFEGSFFASVSVNPDGSFGAASWLNIPIPDAISVTGNTIVGNTVLGLFVADEGSGLVARSYLSTVPEPNTGMLVILGFGGLLLLRRRGRQTA